MGDGEIHPYRHPLESGTKITQSMNGYYNHTRNGEGGDEGSREED